MFRSIILGSALLLGLTQADFGTFAPMPGFTSFNFGSLPQMQHQQMSLGQAEQKQMQNTGKGASTGQLTADEGEGSSVQTNNQNSTKEGTVLNSGSLGTCTGVGCAGSGAAQLEFGGSFGEQKQMTLQNAQGGQGILPPGIVGSQLFGKNSSLMHQSQSQFGGSGGSAGSGSVGAGSMKTVQDNKAIVNKDGAAIVSTNAGEGLGTSVALSGAVNAKAQGQTGSQTSLTNSETAQQGAGGAAKSAQTAAQMQNQKQGQTTGDAGAVGNANVAEGSGKSQQTGSVVTSGQGTVSQSGSASFAKGKKLSLGGSSSASAGSQNQDSTKIQAVSVGSLVIPPPAPAPGRR